MSTTQVTPQPQTNQQVQQQQVAPPPPPEPQKAKWTAADGKTYEDTPDKIAEIAGTRYNELYPEYDKIKAEAAQLREQLQIIQQATTGQQTPASDGQFDQQKYWQMMNTDPISGTRYLNNFVPEYQQVTSGLKDVSGMKQVQEANAFKADNPDFEANESNVEKLARTCQTLFPNTDVYNSQQMTAAYALISRPQKAAESNANIPPPPPRTSVSQSTGAPDINKMDQAQLAAYIRQLESQGAK